MEEREIGTISRGRHRHSVVHGPFRCGCQFGEGPWIE
jgi:hypothetical protein